MCLNQRRAPNDKKKTKKQQQQQRQLRNQQQRQALLRSETPGRLLLTWVLLDHIVGVTPFSAVLPTNNMELGSDMFLYSNANNDIYFVCVNRA